MWITLLLISHPLFQGDERQQRAGRGCGILQRGGEDGHDGGDRGGVGGRRGNVLGGIVGRIAKYSLCITV